MKQNTPYGVSPTRFPGQGTAQRKFGTLTRPTETGSRCGLTFLERTGLTHNTATATATATTTATATATATAAPIPAELRPFFPVPGLNGARLHDVPFSSSSPSSHTSPPNNANFSSSAAPQRPFVSRRFSTSQPQQQQHHQQQRQQRSHTYAQGQPFKSAPPFFPVPVKGGRIQEAPSSRVLSADNGAGLRSSDGALVPAPAPASSTDCGPLYIAQRGNPLVLPVPLTGGRVVDIPTKLQASAQIVNLTLQIHRQTRPPEHPQYLEQMLLTGTGNRKTI